MPAEPTADGLISTRRLEAYTDGVFAIAATLLVLDLSVTGFGAIRTSADLWHALGGLSGNLFAFAISFGLLSLTWSIHVREFEFVDRVDAVATALNSLRLFAVVLIPFTTTINGRYYDQWLGRFLLPLNFFFVVLFGCVQWFYLSGPGKRMLSPRLAARQICSARRGSAVALIISAAVTVASPWVGSWAFALFFAATVVDRLDPDRIPARRAARRMR